MPRRPHYPPRKRGAQAGNTNARKHGFYARTFRAQNLDNLPPLSILSLAAEINLLRLTIQALAEDLSKGKHTLNQKLEFLRVLNHATYNLRHLIRAYNNAQSHEEYLVEAAARRAARGGYPQASIPLAPKPIDLDGEAANAVVNAKAAIASAELKIQAEAASRPSLTPPPEVPGDNLQNLKTQLAYADQLGAYLKNTLSPGEVDANLEQQLAKLAEIRLHIDAKTPNPPVHSFPNESPLSPE